MLYSTLGKWNKNKPYPGAKPSFLIEEKIEDREWISELVRITAAELSESKPKKSKKISATRNWTALKYYFIE